MTKVKGISVNYICDAHAYRRSLNLRDRDHVLLMLRAEGHKRVESFIFERHFMSLVGNCLGQARVSSGWVYQLNEKGAPHYWFRLLTSENPWNASCDDQVAEIVWAADGKVITVTYDGREKQFNAKVSKTNILPEEGSRGSDIDIPLEEVLRNLVGRKKPTKDPRNYSHIHAAPQQKAIELIKKQFSDRELYVLGLSRLLINCHLYPWFGQQPVDIDACIAIDAGVRFIEFKRKYPAKDGRFGLDEAPHGAFVDWLSEREMTLLHVILVDPLWNKNESPTHLFDVLHKTAARAAWPGVELDRSVFYSDDSYETRGGDSGMSGGRRTRRRIIAEAMITPGTDLNPGKLSAFLGAPSDFRGRNQIRLLKKKRDRAREGYGG